MLIHTFAFFSHECAKNAHICITPLLKNVKVCVARSARHALQMLKPKHTNVNKC